MKNTALLTGNGKLLFTDVTVMTSLLYSIGLPVLELKLEGSVKGITVSFLPNQFWAILVVTKKNKKSFLGRVPYNDGTFKESFDLKEFKCLILFLLQVVV